MRIVMMTNTYLPHVSGVAQSVARFVAAYQQCGHDTLVMAPTYEGQPEYEDHVVRIPAIQHFSGSDFSIVLPMPRFLSKTLHEFDPQIIHSHHPFLMGDTALRTAAALNLPLVLTYHSMYEQYTHYVPLEADNLARAVINLTTGYANLCDHVIAPSDYVGQTLQQRGVTTPITTIPTGVDTRQFASGNGESFRAANNIPEDAYVIGHLGRLAPEKNITLLTNAVAAFLKEHQDAHFIVTGSGPSEQEMQEILETAGVGNRAHFTGPLSGADLVDSYAAFDVFVFASKSETQGMVLLEAMAASVPVVALNAPPVDEIVAHNKNGCLVNTENADALQEAINQLYKQDAQQKKQMKLSAYETAASWDTCRCAERALTLYETILKEKQPRRSFNEHVWETLLHVIDEEWKIWTNRMNAMSTVVSKEDS